MEENSKPKENKKKERIIHFKKIGKEWVPVKINYKKVEHKSGLVVASSNLDNYNYLTKQEELETKQEKLEAKQEELEQYFNNQIEHLDNKFNELDNRLYNHKHNWLNGKVIK